MRSVITDSLLSSDRVIDMKKELRVKGEASSSNSEGFLSLQSSDDSCSIITASSDSDDDDFLMQPLISRVRGAWSSSDDEEEKGVKSEVNDHSVSSC